MPAFLAMRRSGQEEQKFKVDLSYIQQFEASLEYMRSFVEEGKEKGEKRQAGRNLLK